MFAWFHHGTRLLTPDGEMHVEALAVGDALVTIRKDGPPVARVVRIERRRVDVSRHPAPEQVMPVRVQAGAFAYGMPARDLLLAPNHAIYADGVFLAVQALCDGQLISTETAAPALTYTRIELDAHDVILAEGLPAASSLGPTCNAVALHPCFPPVTGGLCLPLLHEGKLVWEMRRVLAYRAGWENKSKNFFL